MEPGRPERCSEIQLDISCCANGRAVPFRDTQHQATCNARNAFLRFLSQITITTKANYNDLMLH
jgi:hypothetical protein